MVRADGACASAVDVPGVDVEVEEDAAGYSTVACPFCEDTFRRATAFGVMDALIEHMNALHHEPRSGNA